MQWQKLNNVNPPVDEPLLLRIRPKSGGIILRCGVRRIDDAHNGDFIYWGDCFDKLDTWLPYKEFKEEFPYTYWCNYHDPQGNDILLF